MRPLFLLLTLIATAFADAPVEKIALFVGNNHGLSDEDPLRYADSDAKKVSEVMQSLGGIDKDRSYLLLNRSRDKIGEALQEVAGRVKEIRRSGRSAQVLLYYSGHGSHASLHVNGREFPVDTLRNYFQGLDADLKILIADACHSGALLADKGGMLARPYDVKFDNSLRVRGSAIITSSSAGELSHESAELKGSLFTHALVSGLLGAADADNDRNITLWEAYAYARLYTLRRGMQARDFNQHPAFDFDLSGTESVVLTQLSRGKTLLHFRGLPVGRYSVISASGHLKVADVHVEGEGQVTLALPAQIYLVQRTTPATAYIGNFDLTWGGETVVNQASLKPFPIDALAAKGIGGLRYQPSLLLARVTISPGLTDPDVALRLAELGYGYSRDRASLILGLGYGTDRVSGRFLALNRVSYAPFAEARYAFVNRTRWKLFGGVTGRMLLIRQEPERQDEDAILKAGYAAMPITWGHVYGVFATLGAQINLPWSLSLAMQGSSGAYLSMKSNGNTEYFIRHPVSLSVGWRF